MIPKVGLLLIFVLLISILGCQTQLSVPNVDKPLVLSTIPSANPTQPPTQEPQTRITITETPPNSRLTLTPSVTLTIPLKTAQAKIEELFMTNGGCVFPCWWGFIPGKTTWQEVKKSLEGIYLHKGIYKDENANEFQASYIFPVSPNLSPTSSGQTYYFNGGVLQMMNIQPVNTTIFHINSLFQKYGQPSEIWIRTWSNSSREGMGTPFDLLLYYANKGIFVQYSPSNAVVNGDQVEICMNQEPASAITFWKPGSTPISLEKFLETHTISSFQGGLSADGLAYLPFDKATGKSINELFEKNNDQNGNVCFKTPRNIWPGQFE